MSSIPHGLLLAISIFLLIDYALTSFLYPETSGWIGIVLLLFSLGMAGYHIVRRHLHSYRQGRLTRLKFTRNILLDILGLLLTLAGASSLGGVTGMRLGGTFGLWVGFAAGMLTAYAGAWMIRKAWGKVGARLMG